MVSVVQLSTLAPAQVCRAGQQITFSLEFSEPVRVDQAEGAPSSALSNGAVAAFDAAASGSGAMSFTYTVRSGDDVADLLVTTLDLNGAAISSVGNGAAADLSGFGQLPGRDTHVAIASLPPSPPVITSGGGTRQLGDLLVS